MTCPNRLALLVAASSIATACGSGDGHASATAAPGIIAPSPPSDLTGIWDGAASDSSGPGRMTWVITQNGASLAGTFSLSDSAANLSARGSVAGVTSGSAIRFSLTVAAGGFDDPYAGCAADAAGEGQVSPGVIAGTYSGTNSCSGAVASGQFTLNRQ